MIQALEDIKQFKYYVVYDSNQIRQKDITSHDIERLWETGPPDDESELIDQFWVVYGCLKLLRTPSMTKEYPAPEISICRAFPMFNKLTDFFRVKSDVSEEDIQQIKSYVKKHRDNMERFESRQPGLLRMLMDNEVQDQV